MSNPYGLQRLRDVVPGYYDDEWVSGHAPELNVMLPAIYHEATEMTEETRVWADRLLDGDPKADTTLFIAGPVGTGKTWASIATARHIWAETSLNPGWASFHFVKTGQWLDSIKPHRDAPKEAYDMAAQTALLVLDDLARTRPSEWDVERLVWLMDDRQENFRPTIITTNFTPQDLRERFGDAGDALADRLGHHSTIVPMIGESRRG